MNAGESGELPNELLTKYQNSLPEQATIKSRDVMGLTKYCFSQKLHETTPVSS